MVLHSKVLFDRFVFFFYYQVIYTFIVSEENFNYQYNNKLIDNSVLVSISKRVCKSLYQ